MSAKATLIILVGGKGTRLQSLESRRPKPMILVEGKPFLHWLVAHYHQLGYRSFILSTGHLAEVVEEYDWTGTFAGATFDFARETTPLGTGGAVAEIFRSRGLDHAWVLNGDTFLPAELPSSPPELEALFTTLEPGLVFDAEPNLVVEGNLIVAARSGGELFDAGAKYLTAKAVQRHKGAAPFTTEALLTEAMAARKVGYATLPGTCFDIGTPERYQRFAEFLRGLS